jgi:hypothetical protein
LAGVVLEAEEVHLPSSRSLARPGSAPVDRTKSDRTASISRVIGSCRRAAQHSAEVGFGSRLETIHLQETRDSVHPGMGLESLHMWRPGGQQELAIMVLNCNGMNASFFMQDIMAN